LYPGEAQFDNVMDPGERFPGVACRSLLSTDGDAQTCNLVVRNRHVPSVTEI